MSNLLFIRILLIILSQFFYVFNEKFLHLLSPLSRSHIVGTEIVRNTRNEVRYSPLYPLSERIHSVSLPGVFDRGRS